MQIAGDLFVTPFPETLLGEGIDSAQMANGIRLEVHGAFLDRPVLAGFALPTAQTLIVGAAKG